MAKFHTLVIDRKTDFAHTVMHGALVVFWYGFRLNPLRPPKGESVIAWRNSFARVFCELNQFMARGHAVFLKGLHLTYRKFNVYRRWERWDDKAMAFPTMKNLLEVFKSKEFFNMIKGRGRESLYSVIEKLEALLIELGPVFACEKGFDLIKLCKRREALVLAVDGMSSEYQGLVVMMLILNYFHHFKVWGPRNELRVLIFFGESKTFLGKNFENKFLLDLISQIRGLNIGLVAEDQIPAMLSQGFFSNINSLAMFRHSDGKDLRALREATLASYQQTQESLALGTGEMVFRSAKCKDLLKLRVPLVKRDGFVTREEVAALMRPRLEVLYRDVISSPRKKPVAKKPLVDEVERNILACLAGGGMTESLTWNYRQVGLSNSQGHAKKQGLVKKGLAVEVEMHTGKGGRRQVCLIPNPEALDYLGIPFPEEGKGGLAHKQFQRELASTGERWGWNAEIESNPKGGKEAADVGLFKSNFSLAVEISVTSRAGTECANVQKNLGLGFQHVVLCFINRRVLEKARKLVYESYPAGVVKRASFCMVNEFESVIRGI